MTSFKRDFDRLATQALDVVIIGGGISGAWLALHCQSAGLKTALFERDDFASQTSSASSKLLHGGIRYLQQMQFGKVRESTLERAEFIHAAPHLSRSVPFIVPTYRDFKRSKLFLGCGMLAYEMLGVGQTHIIGDSAESLPKPRSLSAADLDALYYLGTEHTGGVVFYERHMVDSERMVLEVLKSAVAKGAHVFNHAGVQKIITEGDRATGVRVRDKFSDTSFDVTAKLVVNSAGPWVDQLNQTLAHPERARSITGFAIGSHIVTRQICDHAIAIATEHQSDATIDRGGRHVFVIPWRGYSLIGTSYSEGATKAQTPNLESEHVEQLIQAINQGLPQAKLRREDVISGYSGLYPLQVEDIKASTYQGTGEYQIIDHGRVQGVEGIISALGAKFTTGRKLSEQTLPLISAKLERQVKATRQRLNCSSYPSLAQARAALSAQFAGEFTAQTLDHLLALYGSEAQAVLRLAQSENAADTLLDGQPDIAAQVLYAAREEMALTLDDVVFGRTSLGLLGITDSALSRIAELMAQALQWSEEKKIAEQQATRQRLATITTALDNARFD